MKVKELVNFLKDCCDENSIVIMDYGEDMSEVDVISAGKYNGQKAVILKSLPKKVGE